MISSTVCDAYMAVDWIRKTYSNDEEIRRALQGLYDDIVDILNDNPEDCSDPGAILLMTRSVLYDYGDAVAEMLPKEYGDFSAQAWQKAVDLAEQSGLHDDAEDPASRDGQGHNRTVEHYKAKIRDLNG